MVAPSKRFKFLVTLIGKKTPCKKRILFLHGVFPGTG